MARPPVQQSRARAQPHQAERRSDDLRRQGDHERRQRPTAGPFGNGIDIIGVEIIGQTEKTIRHGLGRVPTGWFLTDFIEKNGATITTAVHRKSWTAQDITLDYDANARTVICNVRVF